MLPSVLVSTLNKIPDEELLSLIDKRLEDLDLYQAAQDDFYSFVHQAWPYVRASEPFIDNWHIESICRHLEAVTKGDIKRLIINIPPRSSKSTIVSVMWPVWTWIKDPSRQIISVSYKDSLAVRDCLKSRRLIMSDWFQKGWGDRFRLASDQNQKTRYENNQTGHRIAFGMSSGIVGEGGDIIIIDDPHDALTAMFSDKERQNALDSYDQGISTRLNNPNTSAIVLIMQRLHEGDLTGHVLEQEKWEHLCFPMEYEPSRKCITSLGIQDPREKEGEILCPDRFGQEWLQAAKKKLGTYGTSGQLQQSPAPSAGGIVKLSWFQRYNEIPHRLHIAMIVQFWDTAQKANELLNCPWVCGTWIKTKDGRLYLIDVYREWMDYPTGKRMAVSLAEKHKPHAIVIEDKSTGSSLIQEMKKEKKFAIIPFEPEHDKITRLSSETPAIESGIVYLPESAPWLPDFEKEIAMFPLSATMDQADMLSMALKYFRSKKLSVAEILAKGGVR